LNEREWGKIADRIGDAYRDPFTESQVQEWLREFGKQDYAVVDEAVSLLLAEYHYFPVQATLWSYIKQAKKLQQDRRDRANEERALSGVELDKAAERGKRWCRFIQHTLETRVYPKTHEEAFQMKATFERDFPKWQPRRRSSLPASGPVRIGGVLKDLNLEN